MKFACLAWYARQPSGLNYRTPPALPCLPTARPFPPLAASAGRAGGAVSAGERSRPRQGGSERGAAGAAQQVGAGRAGGDGVRRRREVEAEEGCRLAPDALLPATRRLPDLRLPERTCAYTHAHTHPVPAPIHTCARAHTHTRIHTAPTVSRTHTQPVYSVRWRLLRRTAVWPTPPPCPRWTAAGACSTPPAPGPPRPSSAPSRVSSTGQQAGQVQGQGLGWITAAA